MDGLERAHAEAAVKSHLSQQLPNLLSPQTAMTLADVKALALRGCIQLLSFSTWYAPIPPAVLGEQPLYEKRQLLALLVQSIKVALAGEAAGRLHREELLPPDAHTPFHVQLHLEPGGTAAYRNIASAAEGHTTAEAAAPAFRSPLSCWVDPPCLVAELPGTVHVLLPAQETGVVPDTLRALLVCADFPLLAGWLPVGVLSLSL